MVIIDTITGLDPEVIIVIADDAQLLQSISFVADSFV